MVFDIDTVLSKGGELLRSGGDRFLLIQSEKAQLTIHYGVIPHNPSVTTNLGQWFIPTAPCVFVHENRGDRTPSCEGVSSVPGILVSNANFRDPLHVPLLQLISPSPQPFRWIIIGEKGINDWMNKLRESLSNNQISDRDLQTRLHSVAKYFPMAKQRLDYEVARAA